MQDPVKFPRSPRTSDFKTPPVDALNAEVREGENSEIKILLERPESIEALKSTRSARTPTGDDPTVRPLAAREFGANPSAETKANTAPITARENESPSDDESIQDARALAFEKPVEGADVEGTSTSIVMREPFKAADFLRTFGLIVATGASLLVAGWSYASMEDLRGQLALTTAEKTSAVQALNDSKSHLAATEKALAESQSRLAIVEKAVAGVKAALTNPALTQGASATTAK